MNRISKFFIVFSCLIAFIFSSFSFVGAQSSSSKQTVRSIKAKTTKKPASTSVSKTKSLKKTVSRSAKTVKVTTKKRTGSTKISRSKGKTKASKNVVVSRKVRGKASSKVSKARSRNSRTALVSNSNPRADIARLITARSAMIMDAVTGEAIYAKASGIPAQPASTIKVLTGVISLDVLPKNTLVPVSKRAAMMPRSKVYLSPGRKYPANDLINAVLLASANDASVALAERISGSEQAFAKVMTAKAKSFGATNTVCKTANGLTASGQYTTAHDLAKIFNNAMRNSEFANRMAATKLVNTDGKIIHSHNRALWQVNGAEGGKTGYTDAARKTYVGKFKRDNDEIIVSLMGSETMWEDVKKLVEFGFAKKRQALKPIATAPPPVDESRLYVQLEKFSSRQLTPASSL